MNISTPSGETPASLVFIAGLARLNLSYPENPAKLGSSIFLCGFELG